MVETIKSVDLIRNHGTLDGAARSENTWVGTMKFPNTILSSRLMAHSSTKYSKTTCGHTILSAANPFSLKTQQGQTCFHKAYLYVGHNDSIQTASCKRCQVEQYPLDNGCLYKRDAEFGMENKIIWSSSLNRTRTKLWLADPQSGLLLISIVSCDAW